MKKSIRALARVTATLLIVAAGGLGAVELWNYYMLSPWTRDARVRADVVAIAPDVAGFVTDLRVRDNQVVHKGDILFVIDRERYKLLVATAAANVAARQAQLVMAKSAADRRSKLTNLSISAEAQEDSRHMADAALGAYQQAVADHATAMLNLERTVVRAPVNGFVTNLTLVVGQYASVGTKLVALIDSDSYRVEGYFEETKIPNLKPGDKVEIFLMSGGLPLRGRIDSISRGITDRDNPSGPELLANVTPTFEWVRLAQRIPTHITIEDVPDGVRISAGMTCTVVVDRPPREWWIVSALKNVFGRKVETAERQPQAGSALRSENISDRRKGVE